MNPGCSTVSNGSNGPDARVTSTSLWTFAMLEPFRQGLELIEEIAAARPSSGSLALWWLGQSGFLIKTRRGTLVVDPYLSEHLTAKYEHTNRPHVRMTRAPLRGGDLSGVGLVLASHKHSDHLDPGTLPGLLAASPAAALVLPESLLEHAVGMGIARERLIGIDSGGVVERAGFRVRAVPSAHEQLDRDELGRHLYLGYVIESEGRRLYHSGDNLVYDGLVEALGPDPFDVLFLPINGRDPARGVPGNMTAAEAVDLAGQVRPRFLVPHHYDMFTFNTVPVTVFEAEARRLPTEVTARILRCGERWEIGT
jgi:L-ascorbate metabolism protein UlaG (beta-lactamase superfamily)